MGATAGTRGRAAVIVDSTAMPGPVALVGAGEFLPSMAEFDLGLLAATGRPRARVALLTTASFPDGEATFQRWISMGVDHFTALGAEVEAVPVRSRTDAFDPANAQAVGEADLVYLSGGKPSYLLATLVDSPVWEAAAGAHARGAILAGCSAGAMVLVEAMLDFRNPARTTPALGLAPGLTVIPHFDEMPRLAGGFLSQVLRLVDTHEITVVGVDGGTALVCADGSWTVLGRGGVTVLNGPNRGRCYVQGTIIPSR